MGDATTIQGGAIQPIASRAIRRTILRGTRLAVARVMRLAAPLALLALLAPTAAHAEPWTPVGSNGVYRSAAITARLAGGRVLIAGGQWEPATSLAELIDPKTLALTFTGSMVEGRAYHCGVSLLGGNRVFVSGGTVTQDSTGTLGARSTAEVYDEASGKWAAVKPMSTARNNHGCVLLPDGRVLVAGGTGDPTPALSSVEIYDPTSDTWTAGPSLPMAVAGARMVGLESGDALLTGGGMILRWSAATSAWADVSGGKTIPTRARMARLADGRVLLFGEGAAPLLYQPTSGSFTTLMAIKHLQIGASVAPLPGNKLLLTGGYDSVATGSELRDATIFDGATNKFVEAAPMYMPRVSHSLVEVDGGRVLAIGGLDGSQEVFNALAGTACASHDQCGSGACVDGYCCATSCGGPCEACNVPGKLGSCSPIDGAPRGDHPSCAPYKTCSAGACVSTCASDADCSESNVCFVTQGRCGPSRGLCDASGDVVAPDGNRTSCAPYVCRADGQCLTECSTTLDCHSGAVCSDRRCVPATPSVSEESSGCSTTLPNRGWAASGALLLLLLALRWRRAGALTIVLGSLAFASTARADLRPSRPMHAPIRLHPTGTRLADGRVLMTGGGTDSFEIWDPVGDVWKWGDKQKLRASRAAHSATLLADGRVLVVGGYSGALTNIVSSAEIYDPVANTSTAIANIAGERMEHFAVALIDGRVLVGGGVGKDNLLRPETFLFDPATRAFAPAGSMRSSHAFGGAVRLPDGRVFVAGGDGNEKTDLYDPATNNWSAGPDLTSPHAFGKVVLTTDGKVVVAGASPIAELWDPKEAGFTTLAKGLTVRRLGAVAALPRGEVLLIGGEDPTGLPITSTDVFVQGKGRIPGPSLLPGRVGPTAVALLDGRVLVAGGVASLGDTTDDSLPILPTPMIFELRDGAPCAADAHCSSRFCTDGVCCKVRCQGACDACGDDGTCAPITGPASKNHGSCAPYGACVAGTCANLCANDTYCDDAHVCDPQSFSCVEPKSKCEGDEVVDLSSAARTSCAPYKCSRGSCTTRCATSDGCAAGSLCDQGSCVSPASNDDGGGCAMGRSPSSSVGLLFLLAVASRLLAKKRAA